MLAVLAVSGGSWGGARAELGVADVAVPDPVNEISSLARSYNCNPVAADDAHQYPQTSAAARPPHLVALAAAPRLPQRAPDEVADARDARRHLGGHQLRVRAGPLAARPRLGARTGLAGSPVPGRASGALPEPSPPACRPSPPPSSQVLGARPPPPAAPRAGAAVAAVS